MCIRDRADPARLHPVPPSLRFGGVDAFVSACLRRPIFGDEQRNAAIERGLRLVAIALLVARRIEMERIGKVGARDRIGGGLVDVLAPAARAEDNDIVGIVRADRGDDLGVIGLEHSRPAMLGQGLVIGFVAVSYTHLDVYKRQSGP